MKQTKSNKSKTNHFAHIGKLTITSQVSVSNASKRFLTHMIGTEQGESCLIHVARIQSFAQKDRLFDVFHRNGLEIIHFGKVRYSYGYDFSMFGLQSAHELINSLGGLLNSRLQRQAKWGCFDKNAKCCEIG